MIGKQTFQFLKELKKNNNRNWFNANKEKYQAAAAEFETFVNIVIAGISQFDKSISGISARDCIFRIYRDVRYSKDKSPYKTHFGARGTWGCGMEEGAVCFVTSAAIMIKGAIAK